LVVFYLFFSYFYNVIYDAVFPIKQLVVHDKQSE
ncbi:transporter, partial [Photobacterium sp. GB-50]